MFGRLFDLLKVVPLVVPALSAVMELLKNHGSRVTCVVLAILCGHLYLENGHLESQMRSIQAQKLDELLKTMRVPESTKTMIQQSVQEYSGVIYQKGVPVGVAAY
jgi:hypothetical protein